MCDLLRFSDSVKRALRFDLGAFSACEAVGGEFCVDEPRRHGSDKYLVWCQSHSERLAQRCQPCLACPVGRFNRFSAIGSAGSDIDDAPAPAGDHFLRCAKAHVCRPREIRRQRVLPGSLPVFVASRCYGVINANAGVIDHDIQTTKALRSAAHESLYGIRICNIRFVNAMPLAFELR